ncbi:MAG: hypothetical protein IMZ61_12190, partial [Planctomycetes bacterium]|nr:hypothetical protein [Planctomycetota bacterium]
LGTLGDFVYEFSAPDMNYSIVGGLGDLTARAFAEKGDNQSILDWGLQEDFLDYNTTAVVAELLDRATDELTQRAGATKIDITSQSLPDREPITDYWLGDTVTVVIDDAIFQVKAVEFEIILDGQGIQKVIPTFSNGNSPVGLLHNFDREARTRRAVNRLERK